MVEWGSVEDVVSSCATRVVLVEVGLERLKGINVEGWGCCIFLYLVWVGRVRGCPGFACVNVLGEVWWCT